MSLYHINHLSTGGNYWSNFCYNEIKIRTIFWNRGKYDIIPDKINLSNNFLEAPNWPTLQIARNLLIRIHYTSLSREKFCKEMFSDDLRQWEWSMKVWLRSGNLNIWGRCRYLDALCADRNFKKREDLYQPRPTTTARACSTCRPCR